ncbi:hypothetical protein [Streptomyces sp. NPDC057702]|uniref:hypothetical protein n=1 Tax=unclassified Streptomyces TaxID=2593676 RepID=UPI0036AA6008
MGWAVLYGAFGIVALWLLAEVLLQHKARLRWRLLAFGGFLGVVVGVVLRSVPLIGVGAAAFAVGQTYVTLSFRRGFATGWSLRGPAGGERATSGGTGRRRGGAPAAEPTLRVSDLHAEPQSPPPPAEPPATPTYQPEPLPDDTDGYGIYRTDSADSPFAAAPDGPPASGQTGDPGGAAGYDGYPAYVGPDADGAQHGYPTGDGQGGYDAFGSDPYAGYAEQPYGGAPTPPPADDPYAHTGQPLDDYEPGPLGTPPAYDQGGYGQDAHDPYTQPAPAPGGYPQDPYLQGSYAPGGYDPAAPYPEPTGYGAGPEGGYATGYDPGPGGLGEAGYDQGGYPGEGYAVPPQYSPHTPADGAWVPQQRDGESPPPAPSAGQPDPYYPGHHDPDGQYRY